MSTKQGKLALLRTRWSAIGAAIAVTLGAGGLGIAQAAVDTGDRPVTITVTSERILDTRSGVGLTGPFQDATPRDLQVTGSVPVASGGSETVVPADAIGVLVNVTVVAPTHGGFLSLRSGGATGEPTTSTVNFTPGSITPNAATVDLIDGKIQVWVETSSDAGAADVLIDVVGYTIGHIHDDRYYTEAEVDAAVAAATAPKADSADVYTKTEADAAHEAKADTADLMWARVNADGTLIASSPGLTTRKFSTTSIGQYVATFPRDVVNCALITQSNFPNADVASELIFDGSIATEANVYFEDEAGAPQDRPFSLIVMC